MTEQVTKQRLLELAFHFYTNAESPSDDDFETVFRCLVEHDLEKLENFCKFMDPNEYTKFYKGE